MAGLIFGVGVNDSESNVYRMVGDKCLRVPPYAVWARMIERCYSKKWHDKYPTYKECSVCPEWIKYSGFLEWYKLQNPTPGDQLDKDILHPGNKVYSPDYCIFVSQELNKFLTDSGKTRGPHLIGVNWNKRAGKLRARCNNPFTGKCENIGYFADELPAHLAWKKRKHELACQYADMQADARIAAALRKRYA